MTPDRAEVWLRAWCSYVSSFKRAATAITAADECLAAFDERFPNQDKLRGALEKIAEFDVNGWDSDYCEVAMRFVDIARDALGMPTATNIPPVL